MKAIIKPLLESEFSAESYAPADLKNKAVEVNDNIRDAISNKYKRYKLVINTYCGSVREQGMRIASRCLWQPEFDREVTVFLRKDNFYVGVVVLAAYTE